MKKKLPASKQDNSMITPDNITGQAQFDELQKYSYFQELLIDISSTYINLPISSIDSAINASLRNIGVFVGSDRVYIFDYDFKQQICVNKFEWCADGISAEIDNLQNVPLSDMHEWVEQHIKDETIYIPDVNMLPPGWGHDILVEQGIKSLLTVPLMFDGKCTGFVGFDSVRYNRTYSQNEQHLLKFFANMLANVNMRRLTEESLMQAKEDWENTFDSLTDMVTIHDKDFNIIYANKNARLLLSLQETEGSINTKCFVCFHGDDKPPVGCPSCQSLTTLQPCNAEIYEPHLKKHLEVRVIPRFNAYHQCVGLVHIVRDITQRKKGSTARKESEERLNRAEKTAKVGNWKLMLDTHEMLSSVGARVIYGVETDNLPLEEVQQIPLPEYRPILDKALNDLVQYDIPYNVDFKIKRVNDGKISDIHSIAEYDRDKNIVFGVIHDVTEYKNILTALKDSEEKYRILIENANEAIYVVQNEKIVFANEICHDITGLPIDKLVGKSITELVETENKKMISDHHWKLINGDSDSHNSVFCVYDNLNTQHWLSVNSVRILWNDKPATLNMATDITERKLAEEALKESEARLSDIIYNTADWVWELDINGVYTYSSPQSYDLFGIIPEDMIGKTPFDFMPPAEAKRVGEIFQNIVKINAPIRELENWNIGKDGEKICLLTDGVPIFDKADNFIGYRGVDKNITERKLAEEALQRSEALHKSILNASPDDITITDMKGIITILSPRAVAMFRYNSENDGIGHHITEFIVPEDKDRAVKNIAAKLQGVETTAHEYTGIRADGSRMPIEVNSDFIRDTDGKPTGMVIIIRDITERKLTEVALLESEAKFRNLILDMKVGVLLQGPDAEIILSNPTALDLLGLSEEQLLGKTSFDPDWNVIHEDGSPFPGSTHPVPRAIATCAPVRNVIMGVFRPATGDRVWLMVDAIPHLNIDGTIKDVVCTFINITERKQAEDALLESEELFKSVVNNSDDLTTVTDMDDLLLFASPQVEKIIGVSADKYIGKRMPYNVDLDDLDKAREIWARLKHNGIEFNDFEYRIIDNNNIVRWVSHSAKSIVVSGKTIGIQSTISDITERKQAEEKLQESEERFRAISEYSHSAICIIDEKAKITYVNDKMLEISGYNHDQIMATESFISFLAPESADFVVSNFMEFVNDRDYRHNYNFYIIRADGEKRLIEKHMTHYVDRQGRKHLIISMLDVTERELAKETLKKSEEKFSAAFMASPEAVAIVSFDEGVYIDVNDVFLQISGYNHDEVIGHSPNELNLWVDVDERTRYIDELVCKGYISNYETQYRMKNGEIRLFLVSSKLIEIDNKPCSLNFIQDITERKNAEEALRESEERFEIAFKHSPIGVGLLSPQGKWLMANDNITSILGYTENELLTMTFKDITYPDDLPECINSVRMALNGEIDSFIMDKRYCHKDGHIIWASLAIALIRNDIGEPLYFIAQIKDITARKKAEEALRESEQKFSSYVDFAPHGIFVVNADGNYIEVNNAACIITGYSSDELLKMHILDTVPEESYEIAGNHFNRLNKEGYAAEEMIFRRKDGSQGYWTIDAVKLSDNRFVGFVVDITDRKREEAEKAKLVDQLQQSQKMESVGRLAGGVAHDFNNMLQAILGNADIAMSMVDDDNPVKESLEEICTAAERSADLTRQLLAFARKQTVAPKVLDLNETVANMLKMLKRLIGEDINLNWLPGDGLWSIKVDPSQIDQMLANLCVNARDAIAGIGKITIETVNITIDKEFCDMHVGFTPGEYAVLTVSDNGCGMNKDTLSQLFEPFFTTKGLGKGTGLGLATVYGAVKQNDGHITVYSEVGQGTTFMIYLPRYLEKNIQSVANDAEKSHHQGKETILLVEDELNILKLTTSMLTKLGYNVISANTPVEAIQLADSYPDEIHMVMTDVIMPEMNGRELVKSILKIYPDIKRIFMSGYTADVIAHHGVLNENVNFLQKPFSMKDLADTLRKAMDEK